MWTSLGYHGHIALLVLVAVPLSKGGGWDSAAVGVGSVARKLVSDLEDMW